VATRMRFHIGKLLARAEIARSAVLKIRLDLVYALRPKRLFSNELKPVLEVMKVRTKRVARKHEGRSIRNGIYR